MSYSTFLSLIFPVGVPITSVPVRFLFDRPWLSRDVLNVPPVGRALTFRGSFLAFKFLIEIAFLLMRGHQVSFSGSLGRRRARHPVLSFNILF